MSPSHLRCLLPVCHARHETVGINEVRKQGGKFCLWNGDVSWPKQQDSTEACIVRTASSSLLLRNTYVSWSLCLLDWMGWAVQIRMNRSWWCFRQTGLDPRTSGINVQPHLISGNCIFVRRYGYDRTICAAAAMRAIATITVATWYMNSPFTLN